MPEPRAQRTLVKSPPEIWAEVSDVSALARHLGEFGEIRITRLEAETTVVWEGDRARGTVELEASGWGTKVTLTAEAITAEGAEVVEDEDKDAAPVEAIAADDDKDAAPVEAVAAEAEPEADDKDAVAAEVVEAEAVETTEPVTEEPEPAEAEVVETPTAVKEAQAEPEPQAAAPAPRRGFFARLFRRRSASAVAELPAVEAPQATTPDPAPATAEVEPAAAEPAPAAAEAEPASLTPTEPEPEPVAIEPEIVPTVAAPEPVAEITEAVEVIDDAPEITEPVLDGEITASAAAATAALDPERVEAVLVGVLDDLGSAHHRPFSRG